MLPFFLGPNNQGGLIPSAVDSDYVLARIYYYPPPRSFGIKDLGGSPRQVFGFKGLACKVFKNQ